MSRGCPSRIPLSVPLFLFVLSIGWPLGVTAQGVGTPMTVAERSGFRETTRYDEMVEFLAEVTARDENLHLTSMGLSSEGREIPLVIAGDVAGPTPEAVRASGKVRVYVQGGIHAGEICGKEALMVLLRELSEGRHAHWADSVVLLIAPLYNPDGNERVSPTNRRGQNGPVEGMGQRPNAMGLDLNRDQMKLDAPESRALVRLYSEFDPHLSMDLHTTNGTRHGYHLTYAPPLPPSTPVEIDSFLRETWLPSVTGTVKEATGWDMYYYGGARQARGEREGGWYTFSHQPRYVSNYIGLRNRFGILGEAYSYASFEERIAVSYWLTRESIEFAYANSAEIQDRTARADGRSVVGDSLGVRAVPRRSEEPVTILMGETVEEENPVSGQTMLLRTDVQTPTEMYEFGTFQPSEWETVPAAYFVPPELTDVIDLIQAHGLTTMTVHQMPQGLRTQTFQVDSVSTAEREYQGQQAQEVWGRYQGARPADLAPGTIMVPMDQPLARVAFHLLEPRSDDGLVAWGLLAGTLRAGEAYPIVRTLSGTFGGGSYPVPGPGH